MKILFIVESPTKANTIRKILAEVDPGNEYIVRATMGHIRDLEKKGMSVDIENGSFNCHFAIMDKKKPIVLQLKQDAKECDIVYLASDMDREGESIAWHLVDVMKSSLPFKRITFNEITEEGILGALDNMRDINYNIVNAQIARRIIDRIVGFKMTPLLWKAFGISKLSSGRVQTSVLKIIVENERLVNECVPYYNIQCDFDGGVGIGTSVQRFDTVDAAREALVNMKGCDVRVLSCTTRRRKEHVAAFTTSTLQQVAFQKCGFSVETTMKLAQNLYENGLITYIRTTSSCLSNKALEKIRELGSEVSVSVGVGTSVGAHEAIRPTFKKLEISCANEQKLYDLIYHRTLRSCSTKEAKDEVIELAIGSLVFNVVRKKGAELGEISVNATRVKEVFTHVPLNEGTLIKLMEELGIGRPSTYCSTLERLYKQKYIEKQASVQKHWEWNLGRLREYSVTNRKYKVLVPTLLGKSIIDFFNTNFADIIDVNFTKSLENKLDEIENGGISSKIILQEFWIRFSKMLDSVPHIGEDMVGSEKKVCTFMYNIDGKKFQVRTTKYGPVIENIEEKQFISLNAFLKQSHKTLESLTKQDVMFLISFPKKCEEGIISYGRFGFYMTAPDKTTCTLSLEDVLPPVGVAT